MVGGDLRYRLIVLSPYRLPRPLCFSRSSPDLQISNSPTLQLSTPSCLTAHCCLAPKQQRLLLRQFLCVPEPSLCEILGPHGRSNLPPLCLSLQLRPALELRLLAFPRWRSSRGSWPSPPSCVKPRTCPTKTTTARSVRVWHL